MSGYALKAVTALANIGQVSERRKCEIYEIFRNSKQATVVINILMKAI